jgi:DNA-binding response OmpR family regulator
MKILIVDDDKLILELLEYYLDSLENDIEVFKTLISNEVIDIVRENNIDLVISDQYMPGMKGIDIIKSANETFSKPPHFCLISGMMPKEVYNINYNAKLFVIHKPFCTDDIRGLVSKVTLILAA